MKKVLALVLALFLICGVFAACAENAESTENASGAEGAENTEVAESVDSSESTDAESTDAQSTDAQSTDAQSTDKVKIGYIGWSYTDAESRTYMRLFEDATAACGFEMEYGLYGNMEDIVKQAEILIQAGCKGLIVLIASPALMDLCEENEVYLIQFASKILDDDLRAYLEASEYFVGVSFSDNKASGAKMVADLYDAGCRHILLAAPPAGGPVHDDRFSGAEAEAAKHDDLELITWRAASSWSTEPGDAVANYLATYPEIDGIVTTGACEGAGEAIVQAISNAGKLGEIKYSTLDIIDPTAEYLGDGSMYSTGAGALQGVIFCALAVNNAIHGAPWDFPVAVEDFVIWMYSKEDFEEYNKYVCGDGINPFRPEDYASVCYNINPEATVEDLYALVGIETLEGFKQLPGNQ